MNNPRDFLPAKYKKNRSNEESKDSVPNSPWSDLAKKPEVPEYRNAELYETHTEETGDLNRTIDTSKKMDDFISNQKSVSVPKKKSNAKLAGLLVVFFLVIGVFSSYLLSQQSQDNRQQASEACIAGDPYCINGRCSTGYTVVDGECMETSLIGNPTGSGDCNDGYHNLSRAGGENAGCYRNECKYDAGKDVIWCGSIGGDVCTTGSTGGDWCDDPNTNNITENCTGNMIRCHCGKNWWSSGAADSCDDLCDGTNAHCDDCPLECEDGDCNPPPPPERLTCGEFGCNRNADCEAGLTCQPITVGDQERKICSKGQNQLFCAANPTVENCCQNQPMPVCSNIEILDADNNIMTADDDVNLKIGDEVRFRCSATGNQDIAFDYEFRIWAKITDFWTDLTDTSGTVAKNISGSYVINNIGSFVAQGRICVGIECQAWETVTGSPTTMPTNPN